MPMEHSRNSYEIERIELSDCRCCTWRCASKLCNLIGITFLLSGILLPICLQNERNEDESIGERLRIASGWWFVMLWLAGFVAFLSGLFINECVVKPRRAARLRVEEDEAEDAAAEEGDLMTTTATDEEGRAGRNPVFGPDWLHPSRPLSSRQVAERHRTWLQRMVAHQLLTGQRTAGASSGTPALRRLTLDLLGWSSSSTASPRRQQRQIQQLHSQLQRRLPFLSSSNAYMRGEGPNCGAAAGRVAVSTRAQHGGGGVGDVFAEHPTVYDEFLGMGLPVWTTGNAVSGAFPSPIFLHSADRPRIDVGGGIIGAGDVIGGGVVPYGERVRFDATTAILAPAAYYHASPSHAPTSSAVAAATSSALSLDPGGAYFAGHTFRRSDAGISSMEPIEGPPTYEEAVITPGAVGSVLAATASTPRTTTSASLSSSSSRRGGGECSSPPPSYELVVRETSLQMQEQK